MIRRPPRSTLFPYTRSSDLISWAGWEVSQGMIDAHPALKASSPQAPPQDQFFGDDYHSGELILRRSEEQTSELQSPDHLVCRLLLEKKKSTCRKETYDTTRV